MFLKLLFTNLPEIIPYLIKMFTIWRSAKDIDLKTLNNVAKQSKAIRLPALELVEIAKAYYGLEELTGNNDHPKIARFLESINQPPNQPWCAAYICFCVKQVSKLYDEEPKIVYSPSALELLNLSIKKYDNQVSPHMIQAGDIFAIARTDSTWKGHCGIVLTKLDEKGYYFSIEGNWKNKVNIVRRHITNLGKYYKPHAFMRIF